VPTNNIKNALLLAYRCLPAFPIDRAATDPQKNPAAALTAKPGSENVKLTAAPISLP
jgi:hypothetical protein